MALKPHQYAGPKYLKFSPRNRVFDANSNLEVVDVPMPCGVSSPSLDFEREANLPLLTTAFAFIF